MPGPTSSGLVLGRGWSPKDSHSHSCWGPPLEPPLQTDGLFGRHLLSRSNWKLRPAAAGWGGGAGLATPGGNHRGSLEARDGVWGRGRSLRLRGPNFCPDFSPSHSLLKAENMGQ